jgi:Asp-tRNA(Asn)/Glu-tRNA(Gln) amidotransferase A subunit family amidase
MPPLTFLSAASVADAIRRKEISPVELVKAHLERIEELNPRLNAYVEVCAEAALAGAKRAEDAIVDGRICGSLHGVPISIKGAISVQDMLWETGTRLRQGMRASQDATLVSRLRKAGAIILGVTNTAELLMAWDTDNVLNGRTANPWDPSRTAGGSSGGEAAAIAAGMSAGGVGSDGGGSIRVPAHFSGICGLKPTPGRIPATGHYPESLGPFALTGVVGPMARTVGDLKLLFEAMQGLDYADTSAAPVPVQWPLRDQLRKMRIGYFEDDGRTPVTAETRAAVRVAADALKTAGFLVEQFRPEGLEEARHQWWKVFGTMGGMLLAPMTRGRIDELSPALKQYLEWTAREPCHTGESLLQTWLQRDIIRQKIFQQMNEFPLLLCPAAAIPAFKHGERSWCVDNKIVQYLDAWSYTEWFNLLGTPAVVVPMSRSNEGLPIGVQISARPWQEEVVLSVAEELEAQRGEWCHPKLD